MINSLDDLKDGHLYRPNQLAPFMPGNSAKRIRAMCQDGELDHINVPGPNGRPNYWIDGATVKAWRRKHTTKAA